MADQARGNPVAGDLAQADQVQADQVQAEQVQADQAQDDQVPVAVRALAYQAADRAPGNQVDGPPRDNLITFWICQRQAQGHRDKELVQLAGLSIFCRTHLHKQVSYRASVLAPESARARVKDLRGKRVPIESTAGKKICKTDKTTERAGKTIERAGARISPTTAPIVSIMLMSMDRIESSDAMKFVIR